MGVEGAGPAVYHHVRQPCSPAELSGKKVAIDLASFKLRAFRENVPQYFRSGGEDVRFGFKSNLAGLLSAPSPRPPWVCPPPPSCMCMYACMHVHVHACVCMCMHVHVCMCMCMHVHVCMCICMHVHVCMCMYACMLVHVCMCIRMHLWQGC